MGIFLILGAFVCLTKSNEALADISDHIVVNELQTESSAEFGSYDDWVELYNPTAADISLDGWSIQKANSSGGSFYRKVLAGTILANDYFMIVRDNASTSVSLKEMADVLAAGSSFALSSDNVVYLVNDNVDIMDQFDLNIVDFVGMGLSEAFEGDGTAPNPNAGQSIARIPSGEDTDDNSVDFNLEDLATPGESATENEDEDNGVEGTVLLTISPDAESVQQITANSASIVFQVNAVADVLLNYGLDDTYGNVTPELRVDENTDVFIALSGLTCDTTYHYSMYAENEANTESDETLDAVFKTLPCGITINSLLMTKTSAKANDDYLNGWEWEFDITVWDESETTLKMKFIEWAGVMALDAGNNMKYKVNDSDFVDIIANDTYPSNGIDISTFDNSLDVGRQITIIVQMKVPAGTLAGVYNSSYGILTE